jgi:ribosomal protein L11 methyltransferase
MTSAQLVWTALKFEVTSAEEDLACWLIMECGAKGCEVQTVPGKASIKAYFDPSASLGMGAVAAKFEEYGLASSLASLQQETEEERDWLKEWKSFFKPFTVGKRFHVVPSWQSDLAPAELVVAEATAESRLRIVIEPGMAFGTGLHATTQFCLACIEQGEIKGRVLDVGTGSGILAIAMALLDKEAEIVAIDNDQKALENASLNLRLNNLVNRVKLLLAQPESLDGKFDAILSNMTCEDIIALLPTYKNWLKSGGIVVGAGILKEKIKALEEAQERFGFETRKLEISGEWAGVVMCSI